ncbi:MAG: hypothetical protein ACK4KV_05180 [Rhodocyclaceae bacterium]
MTIDGCGAVRRDEVTDGEMCVVSESGMSMAGLAGGAEAGGGRAGLVLRAVAFAAAVTALLAVLGIGPLRSLFEPPEVELALGQYHFSVPVGRIPAIEQASQLHLGATAARLSDAAASEIERELDAVFAAVAARLPAYADWYFSLRGEYARMAHWAVSAFGGEADDLAMRKARELVFEAAAFEMRLNEARARLDTRIAADVAAADRDLTEAILALIVREGRSLERPTDAPAWHVDALLAGWSGSEREAFASRLGASSAVAGGVALAPLAMRMAARPAVMAAARPAARAGTRTLARAGGAAGAGLLGCSATGPGALVCGALAGGAAWVGTDWMLLQADEWLNRDSLIAEWQAELDAERARLGAVLAERHAVALEGWRGARKMDIERAFSPIASVLGERVSPPKR